MARRGATPASAQLRKFLAEPNMPIFSAADLAQRFERPRTEELKTTVGVINKALKVAHAEGQVICFVDKRGVPLRVREYVVSGSKNNEHPIIYALPGTESSEDGYRPARADEINRTRSEDDWGDDTAPDESTAEMKAPPPQLEGEGGGEAHTAETDGTGQARVDELLARSRSHVLNGPAPDWIPDRVLARIVALPTAQRSWREGLMRAKQPQDRLALIAAGVQRKGKDFSPTSMVAQRLATLCRKDALWFGRAMQEAVKRLNDDPVVPYDELPAFVDDPEGWMLEHEEIDVALVVVTGILVGADEEALAEVADVFAEEDAPATKTVEERLRSKVDELEASNGELTRELKDTIRTLRRAEQVAEGVRQQLDTLRDARKEDTDSLQAVADDQARQLADAREKLAAKEAEADALRERAERASGYEEAATEAKKMVNELETLGERFADERARREVAERAQQEQVARARDLQRQLHHAAQAGVQLPVGDPAAVLRALAGPVGEAARAAGERLATGTAQPEDFGILELAAAYGRIAAQTPERLASAQTAPPRSANAAHPAPEIPPPVAEEVETVVVGDTQPAASEDTPTAEVASESAPVRTAAGKAASRRLPFTITPLGGAEEVGGSALLVETPDGSRVLLDAGQRVRGELGDDGLGQFHYRAAGVDTIDSILISHAHIDHVGSLPILAEEYESPPIYMSGPTKDLSSVMLLDSAKIQAARTNREMDVVELAESDLSEQGIEREAYEEHDVRRVMDEVNVATPNQPFHVPDTNLIAMFQPVDHVLGACAIHLKHRETGATLLYTGDLGPFTSPQRTLPGRNPIDTLLHADVVIMESTYGGMNAEGREGRRRLHTGREQAVQLLRDAAEKALGRGGFILLPTFSLGRTQELLNILAGRDMPEAPIYVGGMGERITTLYSDWAAKRDGKQWVSSGRFAGVTSINRWLRSHPNMRSAAEEILADQNPGYLLVSPAMLSGGWSRTFLELMVEDERHAVLFTGYLPKHAGGIRHVDRVATGRSIDLPDRRVRVAADWQLLRGLSAHAPGDDLRKFATGMARGRQVAFGTVHGEPASQQELAAWIETSVTGATGQSLSRSTPWVPRLPSPK